MNDLRLALRQLGKSPGFSATVIVTLALGIGACTAMFSIVNTVLLNPPDRTVSNPERVVWIRESRLPDPPANQTAVATFLDWKRLATSFETIATFGTGHATLIGGAEPLPVVYSKHGEGGGAVLPIRVILGRWFQPDDYTPGKHRVAVLRYEFWQRAFGGDPGVLSRTILLNDEAHTVIGVAAPMPGRASARDLNLPLVLSDEARADRNVRNVSAFGLLKPGVTLADAQTEMDVIAAQLAEQYPETNKGWGVNLVSLAELIQRDMGTTLWMMTAAVVCVLLIACANVANLQFVRAMTRHREISIRAALGAGRARLIRQLLTESLVHALLGGAVGVLLAQWTLAAYQALAPVSIRRGYVFEVDATMLAVALGLSLGTGLLFGLLPAWLGSRVNLSHALKQATRGSTQGGRGGWLRSGTVAVQVACVVVLLAGAALFLRSFSRLANVDPGFAPDRAIGLSLFRSARDSQTREQQNAFVDDVLARMRTLPGVQAAGATRQLPILRPARNSEVSVSEAARFGFAVDDRQAAQPKSTWPHAAYYTVSPDYFRAAGFRLLRGREFTAADHANAQRVAIINETLARRHFAGTDPIGQVIRIAMNYDGPRVIVGVVSDIKQDGLSQDSIGQVYEPNAQGQYVGTSFVVRHTGDPAALISLLKQQVYAVDKHQPIADVAPLKTMFETSIETPRFTTQLVAVFSMVALVIAAVGIYGVMAYSVTQRTTEIGIRMALGATSTHVLRQVLTRGMRIVVAGLVLGLAATLALSHLVAAMLYHTSPRDPLALTAVAVVLAGVALLACWLPARRATLVDPLQALRAE